MCLLCWCVSEWVECENLWRCRVSSDFSQPLRGESNGTQFSYRIRNIRLRQFNAIFSLAVEPQMQMPHEQIKFDATIRAKWSTTTVAWVINSQRLNFNFLSPPSTPPTPKTICRAPIAVLFVHSQADGILIATFGSNFGFRFFFFWNGLKFSHQEVTSDTMPISICESSPILFSSLDVCLRVHRKLCGCRR